MVMMRRLSLAVVACCCGCCCTAHQQLVLADSFGKAPPFQFRALYALQGHDKYHLAAMQTTESDEPSDILLLPTTTCNSSEMSNVDVGSLSNLTSLSPATDTTTPTSGYSLRINDTNIIHLFPLSNNNNSDAGCWMVLRSATSLAYVEDGALGQSVAPVAELEVTPVLVRTAAVTGQAVAAVLIMCAVPLVLVLVFVGCARCIPAMVNFGIAALFMQSFGFGALIAVAVLHVYPEVVLGLEESGAPQWKGGALVLGSICIMLIVNILVGTFLHHDHDNHDRIEMPPRTTTTPPPQSSSCSSSSTSSKPVEGTAAAEHQPDVDQVERQDQQPASSSCNKANDATTTKGAALLSSTINYGTYRGIFDFKSLPAIVWGLTIGDSIHNLVDGAAIGSAFMGCGQTSGWIVTAAIVAHEIPQEMGDLVMMIVQGATLKQACAYNVLANVSSGIGLAIVCGLGTLGGEAQAELLAFGAGTFLYLALCNIGPKLLHARTLPQYLAVASGLSLAVVALGFTTMIDESC